MLSRGSTHVLIAVPDTRLALSVGSALARRGCHATVACNLAHALEVVEPAVALVGCDLPDDAGFELARTLVERGARVAMIAATPDFDACRRALRIGADELLLHPLDVEPIVDAIVRVARERSSRLGASTRWRWRGRTRLEQIDAALRELLACLVRWRLGPTARARIVTATAEVLDNVRRHAYGRAIGAFELRAHLEDDELVVEVADGGAGLKDRAYETSATRRSGLRNAQALCESMRVESARDQGTRVTMRFSPWSFAFDEREPIDLCELDYLSPRLCRRVLASLDELTSDPTYELSPALVVTIGRLLARSSSSDDAQRALWGER